MSSLAREEVSPPGAGTRVASGTLGFAIVLAAAVLAIAVVSVHRYLNLEEDLTHSALARREAIGSLAATTLADKFERLVDVGIALATRVKFREHVAAGRWSDAGRILRSVPQDFAFIDRLFVTDVNGTLMTDVPEVAAVKGGNFSHRDWYRGVSREWKPYLSSLYRRSAAPQRNVAAVAIPIRDAQDAVAGILVVQAKLESFLGWVRPLGQDSRVLIVDSGGRTAFDSSRAEGISLEPIAVDPLVERFGSGPSGARIVRDPESDRELVFDVAPAAHGWRVVSVQDAGAAFAARDTLLRQLLLDGALILVVAAGAILLGTRALLERRRAAAQRAHGAELRKAHKALSRQASRLRVLHEIDRAIIAEDKPEAIAAAVLQPLRELLGVPRVNVNLVDRAAGEGEWLASAGRRRTHLAPGVRFPLHMLGDLAALGRGEPQIVDTAALPSTPQRDALLASGVGHYMVVPMIASGELIGAVSFGGERASFLPEQTTIAREAAAQLAIAIAHARLFERVTRSAEALSAQTEQLRIVHEVDRAIISEVEPVALAAAVLQPLRELLKVPRVVVNLFDLEKGEVEWLAAAGRHQTRSGPGVRYPMVFMGDVDGLKRGEPQLIDSERLPEGEHREALLASGVRHYMAVPMISGSELIGAVSFGGEGTSFPPAQVSIAQEVATQLAIAISQARLLDRVRRHAGELEQKVRERTAELEITNRELESFSYSVSHDLRAPLRAIDGYALMLEEDYGARLDDEGRRLLGVVRSGAGQMGRLIDDLLKFSQVGRKALAAAPVDMRALATEVIGELSQAFPRTRVDLHAMPAAMGDRALLRQVWGNFIGNALKYSARKDQPRVEIGGRDEGRECVYWVRDNGAGFEMSYYEKLFKVFQRLHRTEEFEGTGVGLAIVQRVVLRHGGRVWGEGTPGKGACFSFSLPKEGNGNGKI